MQNVPATLPPALSPIAEIELDMPPNGSAGIAPRVKMAGDPAALYLQTSEWNQWSWSLVQWRAPDVAAVILPLALIACLWMLWRARKRGRVAGRIYCSGCNHELVAPQVEIVNADKAKWKTAESRCPECGLRKEPVVAGAYWRHVRWRVAGSGLVVVLALGTLSWTLKGKDVAAQSAHGLTAWPFYELSVVWPDWPLYRAVPVDDLRQVVIWRVGFDGSAPERLLTGDRTSWETFVSDDGSLVAVVSKWDRAAIELLDRRTGTRHFWRIPSDRRLDATVAGFGPNGRSVLVSMFGIEPDVRSEFWRIDVATGEVKRVGLVDVPNQELRVMQSIPPRAKEDAEGGVHWAFVGSTHLGDNSYRAFAFVGGPQGWRRMDLDRDSPMGAAHILPDLSGVRFEWSLRFNRISALDTVWNFETGRANPGPFDLRGPLDARPALQGIGIESTIGGSGPSVWQVIDTQTRDVRATLLESVGAAHWWDVSDDDRAVVGVVTQIETPWQAKWISKWPLARTARLLVWELPSEK